MRKLMLHTVDVRRGAGRLVAMTLLIALLVVAGGPIFAVAAAPLGAISPTLGAATSYSVLGGQTVTNTGLTTIPGDLGVSPGSAVTGFPPGIVGPPGTIHAGDAAAAAAQAANATAFGALDQTCDTTYPGVKDLVGESLVPGVYCASAFRLSGLLNLTGVGVWIFKSASDLITSGTARVVGGDPCNVWWREVSSTTLGTNTSLVGNVLASTSISLEAGASLNGRAFAQTGEVTLSTNFLTGPCAQPAATNTAVPSPTNTVVPSPTNTAVPSPTNTAVPAPTNTRAPTNTAVPAPTNTAIAATSTAIVIVDTPVVATNTAVAATNTAIAATNTAVAATDTAIAATNTATVATNTAIAATDTAVAATNTATVATNTAVVTPTQPIARLPDTDAPSPAAPWTALLAALGVSVLGLGLSLRSRRRTG